MLKKILSLTLALALLATGMLVPAASAADYYSARTPLTGANWAKQSNINLAIEAINGVELEYGETFSFNELVGPRTADRGYWSALNGRGVEVTGGGVAQVATTLYLALLNVRGYIQYGPLQVYGSSFTDWYVSDGDLAVITDYNADIDFSFTNYADDMLIEMWASDGYVYCSLTVGYATSGNGGSWFNGGGAPLTSVLVGSGSFYSGDEEDLLHNIQLAVDSVDGTTLASGGLFSFNDVVGPRTKAYGYKSAINGRGAEVRGGGVAQVASVIWLAVKDLNTISVIEKSTYGKKYNQSYVSNSADAILTDYKAGRDFSFRYNGPGTLTLSVYLEDGVLSCDAWVNE